MPAYCPALTASACTADAQAQVCVEWISQLADAARVETLAAIVMPTHIDISRNRCVYSVVELCVAEERIHVLPQTDNVIGLKLAPACQTQVVVKIAAAPRVLGGQGRARKSVGSEVFVVPDTDKSAGSEVVAVLDCIKSVGSVVPVVLDTDKLVGSEVSVAPDVDESVKATIWRFKRKACPRWSCPTELLLCAIVLGRCTVDDRARYGICATRSAVTDDSWPPILLKHPTSGVPVRSDLASFADDAYMKRMLVNVDAGGVLAKLI